MTSTSGTPDSVGTTTALLKTELPRLEAHQQSLEKELAAVTDRLESVRSALTALVALSGAPHVLAEAAAVAAPADEVADAEHTARDGVSAAAGTAATARRKSRKPAAATKAEPKTEAKKETAKRPAAKKNSTPKSAKAPAEKPAKASAAQDKNPSGLTEQVVAILAAAGGDAVRARDVAADLGRDDSPGNINAVRSTLDRLVATSRADRAGRGLYRTRS